MKITKTRLKEIIREEVEKVYKHPLARGVQVIKTGKELVAKADYEGPYDDVYEITYDILDQQGNKIGFLEHDS